MEYVILNGSNIKISRLGLGTVKFGRNTGVKYPENFEIPSDENLLHLLSHAKQLGINLLDTAPAYGDSEEKLGRLLEGQRKDWVIAGKAGEEFESGVSSHNFSPDHISMSLERSLRRLKTSYLDILLLRSDGNDLEILRNDALIKKMHSFKEQGIVKLIGASTKTLEGGLKTLALMDVVMATYTPDYQDEKPILDYALKHKKDVILKKSLSSGHSSNPSESLSFGLSHPATSAIIVGTINANHLSENAKVFKERIL